MLQKIWETAKTKAFIFNAVTILVCVLTAFTIPKLVREINPRAGTENPAINAPATGKTDNTNITEPKELDKTAGDSVAGFILRAKLLEFADGIKFWELSVWNTETGTNTKPWTEIYAEWCTDENILDLGGGDFAVALGGLQVLSVGVYIATITYQGLSVVLAKTEPTF